MENTSRSLKEIEAHRQRVLARLAAEGRLHIAWYDDSEMFGVILERFGHYQHRWAPTRKGGKVLKAQCLGIERRGGAPDDSHKPRCPACLQIKIGEFL